MTTSITDSPQFNRWAAAWGILGVALLLAQANWRLAPRAAEALTWEEGLTGWQIALTVTWLVVSLYAEGYRAFHQRFCPRVIVRARYLANNTTWIRGIFAPFFCMALFHATRRAKIAAWIVMFMVIALIILIRQIPQPWRGIIDIGVVAALTWGLTSLLYYAFLAAMGRTVEVDPQLPPDPEADDSPVTATGE